VTAGQDNAAVIDFCGGTALVGGVGQGGALYQGATAGGAPVGHGFLVQQGAALGADSLHVYEIT
jgi:hypothetical protein